MRRFGVVAAVVIVLLGVPVAAQAKPPASTPVSFDSTETSVVLNDGTVRNLPHGFLMLGYEDVWDVTGDFTGTIDEVINNRLDFVANTFKGWGTITMDALGTIWRGQWKLTGTGGPPTGTFHLRADDGRKMTGTITVIDDGLSHFDGAIRSH